MTLLRLGASSNSTLLELWRRLLASSESAYTLLTRRDSSRDGPRLLLEKLTRRLDMPGQGRVSA